MDSTERVNLRCSAIIIRNESVLLLHRVRNGSTDWVLPGGTPRPGESVASCARREVAEETALRVTVERVAYVLEASNASESLHQLDLVFTAVENDTSAVPQEVEVGLMPVFYPLEQIGGLDLRPPIAGHLRGMQSNQGLPGAPYLGNVWRPRTPPAEDIEQEATHR